MAERIEMNKALAALVTAFAAVALTWCFAGQALAVEEINEFDTHVSTTQAGGHPDVDYKVTWTARSSTSRPCNCEDARVLDMHFPTGFIGNPHNVPACRLSEFALHACPPESQVGVVIILNAVREAMFNLVPHADEAGLTGFYVVGADTALFIGLHARTGSDYGLDATSSAIYQFFPVTTTDVHLWGVPADASHDANRFPVGTTEGIDSCKPYPLGCFGPVQSTAPPAPYLQNPTTCGVPLTASHSIRYYSGVVVDAEDDWPATTGCDQLTFNPSLTATPTTEAGDSMSGLDVTLTVPQTQSPTTPSPSEIRSAEMTLPVGFSLAPNAANGKVACADDELSFTTENAAHCPEFAKIGTSTIDSSALPGPIHGDIYIGEPLPDQTYRLFVTADGFATHVKLKGTADLDPETGRVVTKFSDLPQSPIQEVDLHFFGSERGIFATPKQCGSYPVVTRFTPWDQVLEDQVSTSSISISTGPNGSPCLGSPPFNPRVNAGSADNTAGAFSPFTAEASRDDGDQEPTALKVDTPPGFVASLRGVAYCPEPAISQLLTSAYSGRQEQATPLCPAASRIGFVKVGAGPGSRPIYVGGDVYMGGPYRGAPLSLLVVIPAVSGPYDLGNVVTRVAVFIDPATAQITTVSDPLPRILDGVPLRARYLQVGLDRPGFTLNPTRCDPFSVGIRVFGDEGALADRPSHYQVANCSAMDFSPSLSLALTGGLETRGHPAIHALFKARPGDANTRRVSVTLPNGEQLDNANIGEVCRRGEFASDACPASSLVGHAKVTTPLLDAPLEGNVYLRASSHKLPDLVMDLEGQIDIELAGRVDALNGRLRTTFESVPDAPVTSLKFDLLGGSKGLLVNSEGLCGRTARATVRMTGQNGDHVNVKPKLKTSCGSDASRKRHRRGRG